MDSAPGFAYWFADSAQFPALYDRLRTETIEALRRGTLPATEDVVRFLCARDDRDLDLALAESALPVRADALGRRVIDKLARSADPEVAAGLYRTVAAQGRRPGVAGATPRDTALAAIFGAVASPGDPGWRRPDGLVPLLLDRLPNEEGTTAGDFVPLLAAPFAELVSLAFERLAPHLVFADWVRACRGAVRDGGVGWLRKTADTVVEIPAEREDFRTELAGLLRRAASAPDPEAVLAEALKDREQTTPAGLFLVLRSASHDAATAPVDWTGVVAAHGLRALPDEFLIAYANRDDCPWDLLADLHHRRPGVLPQRCRLPWEALEIRSKPDSYAAVDRSSVIRRGLENGWFPIRRLLGETGTALEVLEAIGVQAERTDEVREALAELVAPLGTDAAAWIRVYAQLPRFRGPCAALVEGAVAYARRHPEPKWPRRTEAETPARPPQGARAALAVLLSAAPEGAVAALAPHLDPRAVQDVLRHSRVRPTDRDAVVAAHGPRAAVWWAAARPAPDDLGFLLGLDDPDVNAMLFRYAEISDDERRRILAGRPYATAGAATGRTGDVPVADDLVLHLAKHEIGVVRPWLLLCVDSGDPRLLRILLGRAKVYTEAARLRLLVRLWERHGPRAVEDLLTEPAFPTRRTDKHPLPPETHRVACDALASPDGLRLLREAADREASPDAVAAYLIGRGGAVVGERADRVVEEIGAIPWDAVLRRHAAKPMNGEALGSLAVRSDCPRELLPLVVEEFSVADLGWALQSVLRQRLTAEEILRDAAPAAAAAGLLADSGYGGGRDPGARLAEAGAELRRILGDSPDAWAVAVHLLPDFSGTLTELAATAAAAAGH